MEALNPMKRFWKTRFINIFFEVYTDTITYLTAKVTNRSNQFYLPGVLIHVLNTWLPIYPLWSGVIIKKFCILRYSNAACEDWLKHVQVSLVECVRHAKIPHFIEKLEQLIAPRINIRPQCGSNASNEQSTVRTSYWSF